MDSDDANPVVWFRWEHWSVTLARHKREAAHAGVVHECMFGRERHRERASLSQWAQDGCVAPGSVDQADRRSPAKLTFMWSWRFFHSSNPMIVEYLLKTYITKKRKKKESRHSWLHHMLTPLTAVNETCECIFYELHHHSFSAQAKQKKPSAAVSWLILLDSLFNPAKTCSQWWLMDISLPLPNNYAFRT